VLLAARTIDDHVADRALFSSLLFSSLPRAEEFSEKLRRFRVSPLPPAVHYVLSEIEEIQRWKGLTRLR